MGHSCEKNLHMKTLLVLAVVLACALAKPYAKADAKASPKEWTDEEWEKREAWYKSEGEKYEQNQREQAAWKKKNSKYDVTAYPNYQAPQRNIGTPEEPFWVPILPPYGKCWTINSSKTMYCNWPQHSRLYS